MLVEKILADEGKAMRELIADIRLLDDALASDERTAEIGAAMKVGVDQLQSATTWLLEQGPLDPHTAGLGVGEYGHACRNCIRRMADGAFGTGDS